MVIEKTFVKNSNHQYLQVSFKCNTKKNVLFTLMKIIKTKNDGIDIVCVIENERINVKVKSIGKITVIRFKFLNIF